MKKMIGVLLTAMMCLVAVFPAFAAEKMDEVSEDVISKIQEDISTEKVQGWTENSSAVLNYEYAMPVYSTIGASKDSDTLASMLEYTNHYSIPAVASNGDCLGLFTITLLDGKWEIYSYIDGLDFITAANQYKTEETYFIEIPQLGNDFGFLTVSNNEESYISIASETVAMSNRNTEDLLDIIKSNLSQGYSDHDGSGGVTTAPNYNLYITVGIMILMAAIGITVYIKNAKKERR
ncbi:MAG: hypothetical protein K2N87_01590 [Eubacterium sp.]|nr:hypothetical protein [Eubacterium sp.]